MRKLLLPVMMLSCLACQGQGPVASVPLQSTHPSHPLAGFWKDGHCDDDFGLLIAPVSDDLYSVSFCGPGGCFEPGSYRPNTPIVGDPGYRVTGDNEIEVSLVNGGYQRYIRCPERG